MKQSDPVTHARGKETYVISDLHAGDGSVKDNLVKRGREELLYRLLDRIDRREGRLILLGDFLELWRHGLEDVVDRWHPLLDRLREMDVVYVLGNHDSPLADPKCRAIHPFFECVRHSFVDTIGEKRFKFMHGHELDPIISRQWHRMSPLLRFFAGALEFRQDACLVTCDAFSDVLCELGEQCLRIWYGLTGQMNGWASPAMLGLNDEKMTWLKRPIRTRNMLGRFFLDRAQGLYDVAVCGHTHKAGYFGDWYYNSGCWTRETPGLLKITPEGRIGVYHWTPSGPCENQAAVIH